MTKSAWATSAAEIADQLAREAIRDATTGHGSERSYMTDCGKLIAAAVYDPETHSAAVTWTLDGKPQPAAYARALIERRMFNRLGSN